MSDDIRDFKDLKVWQKAIAFAKEVYRITDRWPKEERYGLTAQVRRAAVSVSSNIAEGHSRRTREFVHFISIARGSLSEAESQLLLGVELGFSLLDEIAAARAMAQEIRSMAATLTARLNASLEKP